MKSDLREGILSLKEEKRGIRFFSKNYPLYSLAQELVIRGFSKRTIKTYLSINQRFLLFIGKSAKEVSCGDIKDYLLFLKAKGQSNTSLNLTISINVFS